MALCVATKCPLSPSFVPGRAGQIGNFSTSSGHKTSFAALKSSGEIFARPCTVGNGEPAIRSRKVGAVRSLVERISSRVFGEKALRLGECGRGRALAAAPFKVHAMSGRKHKKRKRSPSKGDYLPTILSEAANPTEAKHLQTEEDDALCYLSDESSSESRPVPLGLPSYQLVPTHIAERNVELDNFEVSSEQTFKDEALFDIAHRSEGTADAEASASTDENTGEFVDEKSVGRGLETEREAKASGLERDLLQTETESFESLELNKGKAVLNGYKTEDLESDGIVEVEGTEEQLGDHSGLLVSIPISKETESYLDDLEETVGGLEAETEVLNKEETRGGRVTGDGARVKGTKLARNSEENRGEERRERKPEKEAAKNGQSLKSETEAGTEGAETESGTPPEPEETSEKSTGLVRTETRTETENGVGTEREVGFSGIGGENQIDELDRGDEVKSSVERNGKKEFRPGGKSGVPRKPIPPEPNRDPPADSIQQWINSDVLFRPECSTPLPELRQSYETFCTANGVAPRGGRRSPQILADALMTSCPDVRKVAVKGPRIGYRGVRIKKEIREGSREGNLETGYSEGKIEPGRNMRLRLEDWARDSLELRPGVVTPLSGEGSLLESFERLSGGCDGEVLLNSNLFSKALEEVVMSLDQSVIRERIPKYTLITGVCLRQNLSPETPSGTDMEASGTEGSGTEASGTEASGKEASEMNGAHKTAEVTKETKAGMDASGTERTDKPFSEVASGFDLQSSVSSEVRHSIVEEESDGKAGCFEGSYKAVQNAECSNGCGERSEGINTFSEEPERDSQEVKMCVTRESFSFRMSWKSQKESMMMAFKAKQMATEEGEEETSENEELTRCKAKSSGARNPVAEETLPVEAASQTIDILLPPPEELVDRLCKGRATALALEAFNEGVWQAEKTAAALHAAAVALAAAVSEAVENVQELEAKKQELDGYRKDLEGVLKILREAREVLGGLKTPGEEGGGVGGKVDRREGELMESKERGRQNSREGLTGSESRSSSVKVKALAGESEDKVRVGRNRSDERSSVANKMEGIENANGEAVVFGTVRDTWQKPSEEEAALADALRVAEEAPFAVRAADIALALADVMTSAATSDVAESAGAGRVQETSALSGTERSEAAETGIIRKEWTLEGLISEQGGQDITGECTEDSQSEASRFAVSEHSEEGSERVSARGNAPTEKSGMKTEPEESTLWDLLLAAADMDSEEGDLDDFGEIGLLECMRGSGILDAESKSEFRQEGDERRPDSGASGAESALLETGWEGFSRDSSEGSAFGELVQRFDDNVGEELEESWVEAVVEAAVEEEMLVLRAERLAGVLMEVKEKELRE